MTGAVETWIVPDRVFDGNDVRAGAAVGIGGGRVMAIIDAGDVPDGALRCELPGVTITPGLVDAHLHMSPWMIFGLLAAGVTTVRDLGNDIDVAPAMVAEVGSVPLPEIIWSGPLLEGTQVNWPTIAVGHGSPAAIEATVDELAQRGLGAIKLYANATPDLVTAATARAHRNGMRVLHHLGASGLADAEQAGVDELQHLAGCLAKDLVASDWPAAAAMVAAVDVDHCPTLVVWEALAHLGHPRLRRDAAMRWVPEATRRGWDGAHHAVQPAADRVRRMVELAERMASVPTLLAAGRTILVGSDAPFPGLIPGFSLHDELGLLVESGMSPLAAMRAVTSGNAAVIGAAGGVLAPGRPADLAAFAGDPTSTIADVCNVVRVWRGGVELDVEALQQAAAQHFADRSDAPVDLLARVRYVVGVATP